MNENLSPPPERRALKLRDVRRLLEGIIPPAMCTVAADGTPHVNYLSHAEYIDDEHVALTYQFLNRSRANILATGRVALSVEDPITGVSVVLQLRFERTDTAGPVFERLRAKLSGIAAQTGMEKVFHLRGAVEALTDAQVWLLVLLTVLLVIPSGAITTFSATLIAGFGYAPPAAALLNMPSGAVSIAATLAATYAVQADLPRWAAVVALLCPALAGAGLLCFYSATRAGALAGVYLINAAVAPQALVNALAGQNTQGYTKRVATSAAVAVGFGAANVVGPQTFRAGEAPGYRSAKATLLAVSGAAAYVAVALRLLYGARNRRSVRLRRDQLERIRRGGVSAVQAAEADDAVAGGLTDRTNKAFVYVY